MPKLFKSPAALPFFGVLALTALLYAPVLKAGFVYDDWWYLIRNPAVRTLDVLSFFTNPNTAASPESGLGSDVFRPLGTLGFALGYHAWGLRAWPYHAAGLLLHVLNGFLLWGVLKRLLRDGRGAFWGALVFAWHPVQVQSVAWVSQLSGLIGAAGFLVAVRCFVSDEDLSLGRMMGGWAAYAAAALFKETVLILPLVLLLVWDWAPRNRKQYFAGIVFISAAYLMFRYAVLHHWSQLPGESEQGVMNLGLGLLGFSVYLGKLAFPVALRAAYRYPPPDPDAILGAGLAAIAYGGIIWVIRRRLPSTSRALAWIFIGLLPVLQIVPIRAFVAERFLYIPLMGAAWLVGLFWMGGPKRRPWILLWLGFLLVQTARAVPAWRSEQTLWAQAVRYDPANAFAHACYAQSLGNDPAAEREYKMALINHPPPDIRYAALQNLASWHHERGHEWKANYWKAKAIEAKGGS